MPPYKLTTEVFCLPYLDKYVAYAPLKSLSLVVNGAAADLLYHLSQGTLGQIDERNLETLSALIDLGLVNGEGDEVHEDADEPFRPTECTLFLTTACNLRCVYCYASGGDRPGEMQWPVAAAAVDFVAANAKAAEAERFGVSYHGGGEPTVAWDLLTRATQYARRQADERQLQFGCSLATNGVLRPEQIEWIVSNVEDVNISVDGVHASHDRQRPLRGGGPSFPDVLRTIRALSEKDRSFGLRMTATRDNLAELAQAVEFFCKNGKPNTIHVEPVFLCGRCVSESVSPPDPDDFLAAFRQARGVADPYDVRLYYSGARYPDISTTFCQAAGSSFTITTDGEVTACYEVHDRADPRAETFFYGRYDAPGGRFVFDDDKLAALRRLTVGSLAFCADCFCKYHCSGDCPAKRLSAYEGGVPDTVSSRCYISQELTRDQIIRALRQGSRAMRITSREYEMSREESSRA